MKRFLLIFLTTIVLFSFSSCSPEHETITKNPGSYLYQLGETIKIVDIETGECIGNLTITEFQLIQDTPFLVSKYAGLDDNYEAIYEDVTYHQLTQVNYTFENEPGYHATISADHFNVVDNGITDSVINPRKTDIPLPTNAVNCFWLASEQPVDEIELTFTYDLRQSRHTARIQLSLSSQTPQIESQEEQIDDTVSTVLREEDLWKIIFILIGMVFLLGAAVVILSVALAVRHR